MTDKKPKVLFVIDSLSVGGAERSLLDIVSQFQRYEAVFVKLFAGGTLVNKFEEKGIQVISLNMPKTYNLFKISRALDIHIKNLSPVIIHTTLYHANIAGRLSSKKGTIPLISSLVSNSYSKQRYRSLPLHRKITHFIIQCIDRWTSKAVDVFVANGFEVRRSNALALGMKPDKIRVIPRGRDISQFVKDNLQAQRLTESLQVSGYKVFINVGRLVPSKGQLILIRSFKKVIDSGHKVKLLIAGEGPFRPALEAEILRLDLGSSVSLLGNRNDVSNLLAVSDYFVFPSYYEGLPGALIEAMLAKKPIIATNIPENLECVQDTMALLFEPGNVDQLATCLVKAIQSVDWADRVQRAAELAETRFDIRKISAQYEALYDELMVNKRNNRNENK